MLRILTLLISLAAAAVLGWFLLQPAPPASTAAKSQPPSVITITPAKPTIIDHQGQPIPAETQAQAISHIDDITPPEQMPLNIRQAQHFVTADQLLQLPLKQIQTQAALESALSAATPADRDDQPDNSPPASTSITPPPSAHDPQATTAVAVSAPINLITVTQGNTGGGSTAKTPATVTVRAVSDAGFTVTPLSQSTDTPPELRVKAQSPATLLPSDGRQIKLKELLDHPEDSANKIFYLHAVHQNDDQGMWGIIQAALVNSFSDGIALPGNITTAQASIPGDADERLHDRRSSFLGHILQQKVQESYIYNYDKGMLGRNPDLIQPGQQLVIITFTEDELVQIYQFFATP